MKYLQKHSEAQQKEILISGTLSEDSEKVYCITGCLKEKKVKEIKADMGEREKEKTVLFVFRSYLYVLFQD